MSLRLVPFDEFCTPALRDAWKRLLVAMGVYDIGNTYEWVRCWWEAYRDTGVWRKEWFVLAHESDGQIDAIVPLVIRQRLGIRIVEFLGQSGGFMTDYTGIIAAPPDRAKAVEGLFEYLLDQSRRWDLVSVNLPDWMGDLSRYVRACSAGGRAKQFRWEVELDGFSIDVPLPPDFETYLSRLGKKSRSVARRCQRAVEQKQADFAIRQGTAIPAALENLYRLNCENWPLFENAASRRFMDRVCEDLAEAGEPIFLAEFDVGGQPLAVTQGFETQGRCFVHTTGVSRHRIAGMSPGTSMHTLLIKSAVERGIRSLDRSLGLYEHKLLLADCEPRPLYSLKAWHADSRMTRWRAFRFLRTVRTSLRAVAGRARGFWGTDGELRALSPRRSAPTAGPAAKVRLISREEFHTAGFRDIWKRILRSQPVYDIGNTYEWARCWWESYRDAGVWKKEWFVLAHESDGRIDAVVPLVIRRRLGIRIVEFLGQSGGFMTDYTGIISAPADRAKVIEDLFEFLMGRAEEWDILQLQIPYWNGDLGALVKAASLRLSRTHARWDVQVDSLYAELDLPPTFEEYLASLGSRTRTNIRQYLRAAEKADVCFDEHRGDTAVRQVGTLCELNAENWPVFDDRTSRRFISSVMSDLAEAGEPAVLGLFSAGERPWGAFQGFGNNTDFFLHTAGVRRQQVARLSPGTTMYAMFTRSLIERGCRRFNLGPGIDQYKLRLGGVARPVYRFELTHRQSRMARWRAFCTGRNLLQRIRGKPGSRAPSSHGLAPKAPANAPRLEGGLSQ